MYERDWIGPLPPTRIGGASSIVELKCNKIELFYVRYLSQIYHEIHKKCLLSDCT